MLCSISWCWSIRTRRYGAGSRGGSRVGECDPRAVLSRTRAAYRLALTVVDTMANNLGLPTLAATMDELTRRGFTEHFIPANGMLRAVALRTRR